MHPFFTGLSPTLHIAHRGGAALAPENTLVAFSMAAREYRTDMLEIDLQMTRDGVLVVCHDSTVERCTNGSGEVASMSLGEIQSLDAGHWFSRDGGRTFPFRGRGLCIPSLEQALRALPQMRWNVELKASTVGIEQALAELLRREGAVQRVCCGSENDETAAKLYEALPEACHFYPGNALAEFVLSVRNGSRPPSDDRFAVLDMPLEYLGVRLIDEVLLEAARSREKWINVWTVDSEAEMRRLVAEGVGGIMTDRPDLLRQVLGERIKR